MNIFKNPSWIYSHQFEFRSFSLITEDSFTSVNRKLTRHQSDSPVVSIVIAAWNEELNILSCISSLASMTTNIPFEIIVVDNNSTDNTSKVLHKLNIRSLFEAKQGCGPARERGQAHAKGQYILLADADCIYPTRWLDEMMSQLNKPGTACVYGRYSFISEGGFPRWKLFLLEKMKDSIALIRHYKRPYLNAFGISMGYVREFGLKAGYIDHNTRGDDGRLCFDLMKFGKVRQVLSARARPWTRPRTLQRDGNFEKALLSRIKIELRRLPSLLSAHPPHDTKISKN